MLMYKSDHFNILHQVTVLDSENNQSSVTSVSKWIGVGIAE
jgi:hypothetical protein